MFFQLLLPDWWAVNVLQVNSLAILVLVVVRIVEVLIRELAQVTQIVSDCKWQVLLCRNVARIFNWGKWSVLCHFNVKHRSIYLYRHGCPSATWE